jgi:hypothetical protein
LKSPLTTAQQSTQLDSNTIEQELPNGAANSALRTGGYTEGVAARRATKFEGEAGRSQTDQRLLITLEAFQQLARYLSAIPGRKNVLWFSGSFPIVIDSLTGPRSYTERVRETAKMLSDARVSIYPIDARGLMAQQSEETDLEQDTMQRIAQDTGGKTYVRTNDFTDAVADVIENGSSYYTIAYVPERKQFDGQFHTFKVSVDQGSYKLAYRRGYYVDAPGKPSPGTADQPDPLTPAALHGAPPSTQIIFTAQVLAATDPLLQGVKLPTGPAGDLSASLKGPADRYFVNFTLTPATLALDTAPDGTHTGKIELALIAYNAGGDRVNYTDHQFQLAIKPEQFERVSAKGITVLIPIDLPAGDNSLRIAVNDLNAGRTGSLEVPVAVAAK